MNKDKNEQESDSSRECRDEGKNYLVMAEEKASLSNRISLWAPVIGWAALILIGTSTPGSDLPKFHIPHLDLIVHFGMYGVLGFLLCRAVSRPTSPNTPKRAWLVAIATGIVFGLLDEVHQLWIPLRHCSLRDILADGFGVVLGVKSRMAWVTRRVRWPGKP